MVEAIGYEYTKEVIVLSQRAVSPTADVILDIIRLKIITVDLDNVEDETQSSLIDCVNSI
jgi:hypothetical protein